VLRAFNRSGRAQNVGGSHLFPVARKYVAAARPASAAQDPFAHQRLQNRFEMSGRQAMTRCEVLGSDRSLLALQGHFDDRRYGKEGFAREDGH